MKINTKIRYGLRTMVEICCPDNKSGILQKKIAENQQLSEKYLDPIISALKAKGLIMNVAGKKSGYILNKPASKITILDVFKAFENGPLLVQCIGKSSVCMRSKKCAAKEFWTGLNDVIIDYLKNTTLETLCKRTCEMNASSEKSSGTSAKKSNLDKKK
jgi:Rrf2 family protein